MFAGKDGWSRIVYAASVGNHKSPVVNESLSYSAYFKCFCDSELLDSVIFLFYRIHGYSRSNFRVYVRCDPIIKVRTVCVTESMSRNALLQFTLRTVCAILLGELIIITDQRGTATAAARCCQTLINRGA